MSTGSSTSASVRAELNTAGTYYFQIRPGTSAVGSYSYRLRDLGVKQAPFMVLIGATMPSILAEISFITNRREAALLKSPAYRQAIAEALFNGVSRYQRSLKAAQSVASQ